MDKPSRDDVHVHLGVEEGNRPLSATVVLDDPVHRLRNILEHEVQIYLVGLSCKGRVGSSHQRDNPECRHESGACVKVGNANGGIRGPRRRIGPDLLAVRVEAVFQADNIRMNERLHNLELTVLKPLVLQDLLNGDDLSGLGDRGLPCASCMRQRAGYHSLPGTRHQTSRFRSHARQRTRSSSPTGSRLGAPSFCCDCSPPLQKHADVAITQQQLPHHNVQCRLPT